MVRVSRELYIVRMKRVTASDARKHWFRLLDEVAAGETVCIERGGRTILIRREEEQRRVTSIPDYSSIVRAPAADEADRWRWIWAGPEEELTLEDEDEDVGGGGHEGRAEGEGRAGP